MQILKNMIATPGLWFARLDQAGFKKYRIGLHMLFWFCYLVYEGVVWAMVDGEFAERTVSTLASLPVMIGATYFTLYVLIDRVLVERRYIVFFTGMLISMLVFGILLRSVAYYFLYPVFYPEGTLVAFFYFPKMLISVITIYSVVAIVASLHLVRRWHNHQRTAQELEKEKLESELKLLKSQINPHFLFNTLNSLYVLTLNQEQAAPEVVHKLSELMSYMLYDSNQPEVTLRQELKYIENYIALEKMRYGPKLDVSFNVYDEVDNITIAPLLILPFVENCFKHGVSRQLEQAWVRIDIAFREDDLVVKIENSKSTKDEQPAKPVSGIGLQNIKKRLELIYKDRYQLNMIAAAESYLVILKIKFPESQRIVAKQKQYINPVNA